VNAAIEISDGLVTGLVPVAFVMVIGLFTWIVRELSRISQIAGRMEERMTDAERRLDSLDGHR
jgi:cytochrome oxidase assembly protein ShyY1